MDTIKIYQADAFTDQLFSGNPAAVCILEKWIPDKTMQAIAAENNLAETAFIVAGAKGFEIRWFTPTVEVDLCGHATLATAHVLFNDMEYTAPEIHFQSPRSGHLKVIRKDELLFLDFPTDTLQKVNNYTQIQECIGSTPLEIYKGKTDYIAIVDSEATLTGLNPDLKKTAQLQARGLIVTAKGVQVDFVSRFFAPQSGIDEDPVTGSAHTSLTPIWSKKLKKEKMTAKQLSKRGGSLTCINRGTRSLIGGKAILYMKGAITID